jgi:hypothetical protein
VLKLDSIKKQNYSKTTVFCSAEKRKHDVYCSPSVKNKSLIITQTPHPVQDPNAYISQISIAPKHLNLKTQYSVLLRS